MDNVIVGKLFQICEPRTGEGNNGQWKRQDFVIETIAQYPRKVCFTVSNDKIDMSQYNIGDMISVNVNIESREYDGRWYTDFRAWRVEAANQPTPQPNEISGTVISIYDPVSGTSAAGKTWSRQDYVIETKETYPKRINFSIWGDRVNKSSIQQGKDITASVDLDSRQGKNGGWFSSIQAYRIVEGITMQQQPMTVPDGGYGIASNPLDAPKTAQTIDGTDVQKITLDQTPSTDSGDDLPF